MAELSTLSPSPPALVEPLPAPASSVVPTTNPDPPIDTTPLDAHAKDSTPKNAPPIPKSSLYGDKALATNPESANPTSIVPSKSIPEFPAPSLVQDTPPLPPPPDTKPAETENHFNKQTQNVINSPSPESNPAPNLYPSVQVIPENANISTEQPQIAPLSDSAPPKVKEDTLQPPEEAQEVIEVTTKHEIPPVNTEMATTPSKVADLSPTVPLINEPASSTFVPIPNPKPRPAPDTLSYLESASLMSGTLESLSGLGEDGSSVGSDSEVNGLAVRRTDKYGFLGGSQYSESGDKDVRVEVARQREIKWLDMFNHWDKWVKHRFQKVKIRCRKGIPSSLRAKAWQLLSNSQELLDANPGRFEELEREQGEAKWLDIIEKDLHRQFPFHEMFAARGGHGQQDLYRILKAYTIYRPDEGYCQAQAPVAAVLLMHMPAEQAFWCLVQICEKYLPGYYSAGLEAIQLDGEIFFSLLRRTCPMAYRHLKKFKIDPILYMTEWFMCIFSRTLPWACVLRVWDMFFCEGVKIVFRVGLVLLKQMLGSVDKLRELQGMYETMERLRNITPDMIREEILVQEIVTLPVTESLIERECNIQVRKWRESRGELMHQPGRRLHGTRAIFEYKRRAASISSGGSFSFLGSSIPPPGPLRASSSLLSLPGFRKSRVPFHSQPKKGSFSGPSGVVVSPPLSPPGQISSNKPPIPPGALQKPQSPLVTSETPKSEVNKVAQNTLSPSPKIVSEQITPKIPSPTANNAPLPPCPAVVDAKKESGPQTQLQEAKATTEEDGKKRLKTKEDKKKEKEDERKRLKEKREKEKAEKERLKKEKERMERERKRSGKKKQQQQHGGGGSSAGGGAAAEEKNAATMAKDTI